MILFCFPVINIFKSLYSLVYENDQFRSAENKFQDKINCKAFSFCPKMLNLMTKKTKKTQQRKIITMEMSKWEGRGMKFLQNIS